MTKLTQLEKLLKLNEQHDLLKKKATEKQELCNEFHQDWSRDQCKNCNLKNNKYDRT